MLTTTFLGHQGFLFSSRATRVLVDPLLTEDFCDAGKVGRVFPPRALDLSKAPRIDAVVFTHEHNDHFAVPTIARLDPAIPVFLSARSSVAARAFLAERGFDVTLVEAGTTVDIGDLALDVFASEHARASNFDEFDVLPYVVRAREGGESFFSVVDVDPTAALEEAARARAPSPGLVCYTNNASFWGFTEAGRVLASPPADTLRFALWVLEHHARLTSGWGEPAGVLFAAGGMSFDRARENLNRNVFRADSERVAAALRAVCPTTPVHVPAPGDTLALEGRVLSQGDVASFVRALPKEAWPSRDYVGDLDLLESYAPASGRTELFAGEREELERALDRFAKSLYGGPIFRALCSTSRAELEGRTPTFTVVLLEGQGALAYEYDFSGLRVPTSHARSGRWIRERPRVLGDGSARCRARRARRDRDRLRTRPNLERAAGARAPHAGAALDALSSASRSFTSAPPL